MNKVLTFLKRFLRVKYLIWLLVVAGAAYYFYPKVFPAKVIPQYVLSAVEKGNLTVSVSATGQVSASSQINIKPEVSGKITAVKVKVGQLLKAGDVIAIVDQRNARISLTQAQASLASAQANYSKVTSGTTPEDLRISQLSVDSAKSNYETAKTDYEQTIRTVNENLVQVTKQLNDIKDTSSSASSKRSQVINSVESQISASRNALDLLKKIFADEDAKISLGALDSNYLSLTKNNYDLAVSYLSPAVNSLSSAKALRDDSSIASATSDALNLLNNTLTAMNSASYLLEKSVSSSSFTQSELDSYKSSVSSQVNSINSGISSIQSNLQSFKDAITSAENNLANAQLSISSQTNAAQAKIDSAKRALDNAQAQYAKVSAPADKSSVRSAYSQLTSARAQVESAQLNFDKTIIKSPIDGQVATLSAEVGIDAGSDATVSGASSVATIVTKQQIAIIQLNEVDTAKIIVGQKAKMTFDAIPNLTIDGTVSEIEGVGVVTSGVVNYNIKVSFDTQEERVKTGMSTSVDIITSSKDGILLIPSEALKSGMQDINYVEMLPGVGATGRRPVTSSVIPVRQAVEIGESNDTQTEIKSGLIEGDLVISQVISTSTAAKSSSAASNKSGGFPMGGGR
ncbi:MAG: biotin/lipoyl-binding protein [Patescibacteria group bacterium]